MNIKGEDGTSEEVVNIKREKATVPVQLTQKSIQKDHKGESR